MRTPLSGTSVTRTLGASGLALAAALLMASSAGAQTDAPGATGSIRPPVALKELPARDDTRQITRRDEEFGAVGDLVSQRRKGLPFAEHEVEILDAWSAGLPVAQIEVETLLSGAIYRLFIEGSQVSDADRDLVERWRAYRAAHAPEILARAAELVGADSRDVAAPDGSRDFELYWDPELYNQLSSAYQRRLQRIYGFRTVARRAAVSATAGTEAPSSPSVVPANILVNDSAFDATTQDTQSETGLVLGSSSKILVAFNDSGSDFAPNASFTGIARSTDGGATFTDQGRLPATATSDAGDPVLVRNTSTGRAFLSTLGFNSGSVLQCFRSDDDGATYQPPVDCDGVGATASNDKEWLAVDNFAGSGQGNVYNFYRDFGSGGGMSMSRSTDGGSTWSARVIVASASGQGAFPVVGADHAVYAFWLATGNVLQVKKSTDQGLTFGSPVTMQTLRTAGTNGDFALGGGFRTNAFPQAVANPVDASQLYAVWTDKGVSPSPDKANVYLKHSTDGGATWGAEVQVNADAGTHDNWQPTIAITPDGTKLFVSWYDRRNDVANSLIDVYARIAAVTGPAIAFGNDFQINDASFPVVIGQDAVIVATYMGDYDTAVADNTTFYRTWGDNRLPRLSHTHQPDVRFAAIPATGPGPILAANGFALISEGCTPANAAIDPGENATVSFGITNIGSGPTTDVVATLLATGGITNPSLPQHLGAVGVGVTVNRNFEFIAAAQACGSSLTASIHLQDGATDMGTTTYLIPLGLVDSGTSTTTLYSSGNIAVPIPDSGPMADQISAVGDVGAVADVNVKVRLTHTFDGDLSIRVVSPDSTLVALSNSRGSSGDNFGTGAADCSGTFTVFDDSAATPIGSGVAPFAGSFIPDAPLADLNGRAVSGNWTFRINDGAAGDSGTLHCWQMEITRHPYVCSTTCGGLFSDGFESGGVCLWSFAVGDTGVCLTQP